MATSNVLFMQFNSQKSTAGLTTCFTKLRRVMEDLDPGRLDRPTMGNRRKARWRRWQRRLNESELEVLPQVREITVKYNDSRVMARLCTSQPAASAI